MQITKKVMKIVEKKEKSKADLNRCLNTLTCPECGEALKRPLPAFIDYEFKYICTKCSFTHTRLEA